MDGPAAHDSAEATLEGPDDPAFGTNSTVGSPRGIDPNTLTQSSFFFGKTLGEGSYARVVHAKLKSEQSPQFAIKIMEKQHIKKEDKVASVMMEKKILSAVNHPFIIKLYYTFQDKEYLYMCMDLVPGGELLSLIYNSVRANEANGVMNKACDITTATFYIAEVSEALEYLHEKDIIHLDLKPENILIGANGHVKVADFGTALMDMDEESMKNIFVGTAEYVSPELLSEEDTISRSCDIWALGCILFQLLSGKTPFHAVTEYMIFEAIHGYCDGTQPLDFPETVQGHAKDLVEALLRNDTTTRLGAGDRESDYSYSALKAHPFFNGVAWGALESTVAPYTPDPSKFPSTDNMHDGADEDWMMEGDATVYIPEVKTTEISKLPPAAVVDEERESTIFSSASKWSKFLRPGEKKLFTGLVEKRVGLFSKRRQLILTDTPRLIYVDPKTMEEKGEIPWTLDKRVRCVALSASQFDVHCEKTGRSYHFKDIEGAGSDTWIHLIDAMLEKQTDDES